jgi:hypothetical protein
MPTGEAVLLPENPVNILKLGLGRFQTKKAPLSAG